MRREESLQADRIPFASAQALHVNKPFLQVMSSWLFLSS